MSEGESGASVLTAPEAPVVEAAPAEPLEPPTPWTLGAFLPSRPTVEFLILLLIGILFARAFAAEAYIVPTGSMAPTLLGMHRDYLCPSCSKRFAMGMDEGGRIGRPVCPNCGHVEFGEASVSDGLGDRLLVQKFLYDLRPPRRWEVVVFQNPADPSQAYVKRVVALPDESVLLSGGDVMIDNHIARKTLAEIRAMAVPVYDHEFLSRDIVRYPRFWLRRGETRDKLQSGWAAEGSRFVRKPTGVESERPDWVEYRHWQPDRGTYGPIRDYTPYNGADVPGESRVKDLLLTAKILPGVGTKAILARIDSGSDRFVVNLPIGDAAIEVRRNGRRQVVHELGPRFAAVTNVPGKPRTLEVGVFDRRLFVALDGELVIDPIDYEDPRIGPPSGQNPVALGVTGDGAAEISGIRIDRDVYYTESLSQTPRRPFGVEAAFTLGPGEYFVLGDNSPVSNDSRFWPGSPVVTLDRFLGKPFLVHLPSQAVPLKVFGRELYWIPDPREIRYIR